MRVGAAARCGFAGRLLESAAEPALKERGIADDDLGQMVFENPERWLGS
jgi:hypothetical protein